MTETHVLRDVLIIFIPFPFLLWLFSRNFVRVFSCRYSCRAPHGLNLISDGEQVETLKSLCSSLFCVGPLCLKPPLQAGGKALRWKNQNLPHPFLIVCDPLSDQKSSAFLIFPNSPKFRHSNFLCSSKLLLVGVLNIEDFQGQIGLGLR
jgi:hypothetical protein